jgi:hypothetical protein
VGDSTHSLTSGLTATSYETKTRGHREQGAARVVGEGSYLLTQQGPRGATQLVYKVLVPPKPGPAQATFKLGAAGSFLIKAKVGGQGRRLHSLPLASASCMAVRPLVQAASI